MVVCFLSRALRTQPLMLEIRTIQGTPPKSGPRLSKRAIEQGRLLGASSPFASSARTRPFVLFRLNIDSAEEFLFLSPKTDTSL